MTKGVTTVPDDKLLAVLRGLSPAALRAVIEELARIGGPGRPGPRPPRPGRPWR
jgi:hypothetical protein